MPMEKDLLDNLENRIRELTFLDVSDYLLEDVHERAGRGEQATASRVRWERPERPGVHLVAHERR